MAVPCLPFLGCPPFVPGFPQLSLHLTVAHSPCCHWACHIRIGWLHVGHSCNQMVSACNQLSDPCSLPLTVAVGVAAAAANA